MEGDKEVAVGGGVGRAARDGGGWNNLVETKTSVSREVSLVNLHPDLTGVISLFFLILAVTRLSEAFLVFYYNYNHPCTAQRGLKS